MPTVTWTRDLAAHLLRRAGFGATQAELDRYEQMSLRQAVNTLVDYDSIPNTELDALLAEYNFDFERAGQVQSWWLVRMLYTARPLEEKMVFYWHNHFATSAAKVQGGPMKGQIDLFRAHALGNFRTILVEVSKDPAMLDWLDNRRNRVGRPNENYARELLELFSMGIGNYTETDIQEIARCFTGWTIREEAFYFAPGAHDDGAKTFLGTTVGPGGGVGDGERVCDVVAAHPATAQYMARRLFEFFAYPGPSQAIVNRFADVYASSGYSIRELVREILMSDELYSDRALFANIKSPAEYVLGAFKALNATVDFRRLAGEIGLMGQVLLFPPDVGGWDGGLDWINTTTLLARANFANSLVTNRRVTGPPRGHTIDPNALLAGTELAKPKKLVNHFLDLLGPIALSKKQKRPLIDYIQVDDSGAGQPFALDEETIDEKVRGLIHLIMALPEYHQN
jgi:uncharacterized protein (DUF1800 family)